MILLFLLSSCAYPDIDTVPDFKDVIITKEDSIELCIMNNPYKKLKYYISPSNVLIISPSKELISVFLSIMASGYASSTISSILNSCEKGCGLTTNFFFCSLIFLHIIDNSYS